MRDLLFPSGLLGRREVWLSLKHQLSSPRERVGEGSLCRTSHFAWPFTGDQQQSGFPGEYLTQGSGPLKRVLIQRNQMLLLKAGVTPWTRAAWVSPAPPCLIGYHTPNCSCSWTQHSTPVEEEKKIFLIQGRRKPSFCLGNSKNKTAWMGKKVNGKIRSLSGVLERLRVLTEHSIH